MVTLYFSERIIACLCTKFPRKGWSNVGYQEDRIKICRSGDEDIDQIYEIQARVFSKTVFTCSNA